MDNYFYRQSQGNQARATVPRLAEFKMGDAKNYSRSDAQRRSNFPSLKVEMTDIVARERIEEDRTKKLSRFFMVLIIVLVGIIALELIFHFVVGPRLVIKTVKINAETGIALTDSQILELADLSGGLSYFGLDTKKIQNNLLRSPLVQSAEVKKNFPDSLEINLKRRNALGFALETSGDRLLPLVFDENGVVFMVGGDVIWQDLPVISGILFPDPRPGLKFPESLSQFLTDLYTLKTQAPVLFNEISELKFIKKNASEFEVMLYPKNYRTKVRIGTRINENLMKNILMVLDMVQRENIASSDRKSVV